MQYSKSCRAVSINCKYKTTTDTYLNIGAGFHSTPIEEVCIGNCCCCPLDIMDIERGSFEVSKPADTGGVIG